MICCVTGHRPNGFPFFRREDDVVYSAYKNMLNEEINKLINEGYLHFITGMADGADIDFANVVLSYRNEMPWICIEAAMPYPYLIKNKENLNGDHKAKILSECDSIHIVSPYYHKGFMQKRNQYMVDKSDLILAIWNGEKKGGTWNTIKYAQGIGKRIRYIMLDNIKSDHY